MTDIPDRIKRRAKIEAWLMDWFEKNAVGEIGDWGVDDRVLARLADALEREIETVLK